MNYASIPNRSFVLALCGLVLVGSMPRVGCICASGEFCVDCSTNANCTPSAVGAKTEPTCCCCETAPAVARHGAESKGPALDRCPCIKVVTQLPITSASRQPFECQSPLVSWLPGHEDLLELSRAADSLALAAGDHLPPDDPVSRAQILRL
jgi:hypothetical protein